MVVFHCSVVYDPNRISTLNMKTLIDNGMHTYLRHFKSKARASSHANRPSVDLDRSTKTSQTTLHVTCCHNVSQTTYRTHPLALTKPLQDRPLHPPPPRNPTQRPRPRRPPNPPSPNPPLQSRLRPKIKHLPPPRRSHWQRAHNFPANRRRPRKRGNLSQCPTRNAPHARCPRRPRARCASARRRIPKMCAYG